MPVWLRAAPNPIFVSGTRASQTRVRRRRKAEDSHHAFCTLTTLTQRPSTRKAKRSQDTPRPMLLYSQVRSHCHEKVFAFQPRRAAVDAAERATKLSLASIDSPQLMCHVTSAPSLSRRLGATTRFAASPRHSCSSRHTKHGGLAQGIRELWLLAFSHTIAQT